MDAGSLAAREVVLVARAEEAPAARAEVAKEAARAVDRVAAGKVQDAVNPAAPALPMAMEELFSVKVAGWPSKDAAVVLAPAGSIFSGRCTRYNALRAMLSLPMSVGAMWQSSALIPWG
jgi:hypothetical protein